MAISVMQTMAQAHDGSAYAVVTAQNTTDEAVYWLSTAERQEQTWDGFVSVLALLSQNRLSSVVLSDLRFLAFVLQNVDEQRYSATVTAPIP